MTEILSRIQFALTVGFHILFPTLNIGLSVFLMAMEATWLKTKKPVYLKICKYWTKIFALTFGMGVVSGVVMAFELGTNFGRFTNAVGAVLGPLFSYEVMSAFFLEAGFLGVMLFGWKKVGPKTHFFATAMVAIGTVFSAFWIMSANSWMQYPTGFEISHGKYLVDSWSTVIFSPTLWGRLTHMLFASFVTSSFVIAGVSAWYLLKKKHLDVAKPCFNIALAAAVILVPLQLFLGDLVGLHVLKYQPEKTAAMEANWHKRPGAPFVVFAIPDQKKEKNLYAIEIPYGASLINTHKLNGVLPGVADYTRENQPPVAPVFFTFRIMVGIGLLFLIGMLWALWLRMRGRLYDSPALQKYCVFLAPLGFVATVTGWITSEMGRQPWVVYHHIRTADATSNVPVLHLSISLALFVLVYGIIFSFYLRFLFRLIKKGPTDLDTPPSTIAYLGEGVKR